jgi:hypothetical protein
MSKQRYYRNGVQIDDAEAFDARGVLRTGVSVRVSMTARDSDELQRGVARHSARVTDAQGNSGLALRRPGFRFLLDDAAGAHVKAAAYQRADAEMVNAWRNPPTNAASSSVCPECDGSGVDENGEDYCPACGGTGALDAGSESNTDEAASRGGSDSRSVNQIVRDHQANMARIYDDHDRKLSETWRRS